MRSCAELMPFQLTDEIHEDDDIQQQRDSKRRHLFGSS